VRTLQDYRVTDANQGIRQFTQRLSMQEINDLAAYYGRPGKNEITMKNSTALRSLSILALVEGASLVALIGIAMPLKYFADLPEAVRVVGMAHGILFLWASTTLALVVSRGHLSLLKGASVFAASLIPLAGLWSHRMLVRTMRNQGNSKW